MREDKRIGSCRFVIQMYSRILRESSEVVPTTS